MGVELLITVLVVALIVFVAFWIVDQIGFPNPINMIAKAIVGVIGLVYLLQKTGLV
jgi:hypothetical protein